MTNRHERDVALFRAMSLASRQLNAAVEQRVHEAAGISLPEFDILSALRDAPGHTLRAGELGLMLAWEKSRTSHQVARMQRRGLVERTACDDDLRGILVRLTQEGRAAVSAADPAYREVVSEQLEAISGTEDAAAVARVALRLSRVSAPTECQGEVTALERTLGLIAG